MAGYWEFEKCGVLNQDGGVTDQSRMCGGKHAGQIHVLVRVGIEHRKESIVFLQWFMNNY